MNVRVKTMGALVACSLLAGACGAYVDGPQVAAGSASTGAGAVVAAGPAGDIGTVDAGEVPGADVTAGEAAPSGVPGVAGPSGGGAVAGAAGGSGGAATPAGGGSAATPEAAAAGPQRVKKYDDGVTDTEIKLGVSAPLSGLLGFAGEEVTGAIDSYVKVVNEKGGIGGRKVKLIAYDDRLDPSLILANMKRLVEQDKVFAVYGLFADSVLEYIHGHPPSPWRHRL